MLRILGLFAHDLKRTSRPFLLFTFVLFLLESAYFFFVYLIRELSAQELPSLLTNTAFSAAPYFFYIPAFLMPMMAFRRSVFGRDALFMHGFPLPVSAFLVSMLLNSLILTAASRLFSEVTSFVAVLFSDRAAVNALLKLSFSRHGAMLNLLLFFWWYLAIVFGQLFISMISLLAAVGSKRKDLLTALYGFIGGIMILLSYIFISAFGTDENSVFGTFFPQMIYFLTFSVFFFIVDLFVMKRKIEYDGD